MKDHSIDRTAMQAVDRWYLRKHAWLGRSAGIVHIRTRVGVFEMPVAEAEDLVSDVYTALIASAHVGTLRSQGASALADLRLQSRALDKRRRVRRPGDDDADIVAALEDRDRAAARAGECPTAKLVELWDDARRRLAVTEEQTRSLLLLDAAGFTTAESARIAGLSAAATRKRLSRARTESRSHRAA
jgi:DNA-directed RNA polymerase specialized sigma24 family protein